MDKIPIRHIKEPSFSESFTIRDIGVMLSGKDMIQELHRHDFFFVLVAVAMGTTAGMMLNKELVSENF